MDTGQHWRHCTNVIQLFCVWTQPSKHEAMNQCWFDSGPVSQTGQHWTSFGSTLCLLGVLTSLFIKGPSKLCSLDPLPTSLLKKTITAHLPILCQIINWSLKSGVFPAMLKTADVTPLIKKPSLDQDSLNF